MGEQELSQEILRPGDNPLYRAWYDVGGNLRRLRYNTECQDTRSTLVNKYAWAVPDDRSLEIVAKYSPIVEMGAGTGYWAKLLSDRGVDIVAYDKEPGNSHWCNRL